MTVRKNKKGSLDPELIAAAVPAAALTVFNRTSDYRAFTRALTEEVKEITGQYDHGLTLRVAEVLGVSPVDWFQRTLSSKAGFR